MNNKTINFNCGQLIQLIGKTINFSEPLIKTVCCVPLHTPWIEYCVQISLYELV